MMTVLFASYNGEATLERMLNAFCDLIIPHGGFKIVAVDNASTDRTKDIILAYTEALPLTYLYEQKQGKNHALNKGLKYVEGDLAVFTDDDIIPEKDWLQVMRQVADDNPEYAIFGGTIKPMWGKPPSPWNTFSAQIMAVCYAATDPHWPTGEISAGDIWGPNMMLRNSIIKKGHLFDTIVGPDGSTIYAMGSESELTKRLESIGYKCFHINNSIVHHIIPERFMSKKMMFQRAQRYGRSQFMLDNCHQKHSGNVVTLFGVPRYMIKEIIISLLLGFLGLMSRDLKHNFRRWWKANYLIGYCKAHREKR